MPDATSARAHHFAARLGAEFVVIVLGVLVALAVDAALERRAEIRLERAYYRALTRDLAADTTEYNRAIRYLDRSIQAAEHVSSVIRGTRTAGSQARPLSNSVEYAGWVNYPEWSTGTMDELVNSGSIRLLRDGGIKNALLAYYAHAREWRPRMQGPEHSTHYEYRRMTRGMVPGELSRALWVAGRDLGNEIIPEFDVDEDALARRIRGDADLLLVTEAMTLEWWSLRMGFEYESNQTLVLLQLLETKITPED